MRRLLAIIAAALTFSLFTQASAAPPVPEVKVINTPLPVTGLILIDPPATFFKVVTPTQAVGGAPPKDGVSEITFPHGSLLQTVDIQMRNIDLQGVGDVCRVRLFRNPQGANEEFLFRQFLDDDVLPPSSIAQNISVAPGVLFLAGDTLQFRVEVSGPNEATCRARGHLFFEELP